MTWRRLSPVLAAVVTITAAYAVLTWSGVEQWRNGGGDDAFAYRDYVERLYRTHHLPPRSENYEYALPPGAPAIGVAVTWAFQPIRSDRPSPPLQSLPRELRRLIWLALVAGGALLLARAPPFRPAWVAGAIAWVLAAAWAWAYLNAAVDNERWLPLVLVTYVSAVALVPATAWLAHEVWPAWRWAPPLGAVATVLMPAVLMSTLYFHPDPLFAVIATVAIALVLRALRTGLTVPMGIAAGATVGAAALVRQSAPVIGVALVATMACSGWRESRRYLAATTLALLAVAGPWWVVQTHRFHNPLESNLDRPGQMLDHEPLSFFVSFPTQLVTQPRAPAFQNELLPRFHAYLWSDWGGQYHHWGNTKAYATTLAKAQSVLGFGGDALVLGGVALLGIPAFVRVVRRGSRAPLDRALAVLAAVFVLSWVAYVAELVRFPQSGGDPIKAHYLLFLAPVSAVFAIAAASVLVRRGGWRRVLVACWVVAYSVSWALTFATAF